MLACVLNRRLLTLLTGCLLCLHGGLSLAAGSTDAEASDVQSQGVLARRFSWQSPLDLSQGYLAGKSWAQGLSLVGNSQGLSTQAYSNPGLKLTSNAYLGLGYGTSVLNAKGLDFYADVGLSVGNTLSALQGLSTVSAGVGSSTYELSPQRGWREMFGGMTLIPSASIGLVYRY